MENWSLHVHAPGPHVGLQYDTSSDQGSRLEGQILQNQGKSLQLEVECLSFMHCSEGGRAQVVDLKEGNWGEKSAPEGVLFSAEALLPKQRPALLRLRVRSA